MNLVPAATKSQIPPPRTSGIALDAPAAHSLNGSHPLEHRVKGWDETQRALHMDTMRRVYGAGEPIRRGMEQLIVEKSTFVPAAVGGSTNLHLDILQNRDATVTWEDVHADAPELSFHKELEARMFK